MNKSEIKKDKLIALVLAAAATLSACSGGNNSTSPNDDYAAPSYTAAAYTTTTTSATTTAATTTAVDTTIDWDEWSSNLTTELTGCSYPDVCRAFIDMGIDRSLLKYDNNSEDYVTEDDAVHWFVSKIECRENAIIMYIYRDIVRYWKMTLVGQKYDKAKQQIIADGFAETMIKEREVYDEKTGPSLLGVQVESNWSVTDVNFDGTNIVVDVCHDINYTNLLIGAGILYGEYKVEEKIEKFKNDHPGISFLIEKLSEASNQ